MKRLLSWIGALAAFVVLLPAGAEAFCGFYVSKADTKLFNKASKVVLVRDGDRTVMTMSNDFKGDPREFAVVIPVPTFLTREQIHVGEQSLVDHLDAFTAPRLVEYFDEDPCRRYDLSMAAPAAGGRMYMNDAAREVSAQKLGVRIEATYSVGEYEILILSAKESGGLETWLRDSGYRLPGGAGPVLASYLRQNMRFFVAKVNVAAQKKLGFNYLRPLQVAYESPKFMLPIRLGTLNAEGTQELFVFALTRKGRVEPTNYRTVRLPTDVEIPAFVKTDFARFYRAMFTRQVEQHDMSAVFLEYAWDMNWCDPCAADPLTNDELQKLGVFWLSDTGQPQNFKRGGGANDVFVTRLHVRYDGTHFPEDLVFQATGDRSNFQGRYILRHPWKGASTCSAAAAYRSRLPARAHAEASTLASLTGWTIEDIRDRMGSLPAVPPDEQAWWRRIWK